MTIAYERRIELEGSLNFRDLGGYRTLDGRTVRWRALFRSDAPGRMTGNDVKRVQAFGLRTLIDLRTDYEIENDQPGEIYNGAFVRRHIPLVSSSNLRAMVRATDGLHSLYTSLLERAQSGFREVFAQLALAETYPAVVHCSIGKDRAGLVSALVLRSLGVDEETIIEDYALSNEYVTPSLLAWAEREEQAGRTVNRTILGADAAIMRLTLDTLNEHYGHGDEYLLHSGITPSQIAALKALLLSNP